MSTVEQVKQCRTPQEALLVLATAIDELKADALSRDFDWTSGLVWEDRHEDQLAPEPDNRAQIVDGDVIVKPVSQERQDARRLFAVAQRLHEFYGPALDKFDFESAYAKGGPRWLVYTNRECVMQMPRDLRQQLVADVELDSPEEAAEISRDILKVDESVPEGTQIDWQRAARDLGPLA